MMALPPQVPRQVMWTLLRTVEDWEETLTPVIRGGLLMTEWFGDAARPLSDLDLECFQRTVEPSDSASVDSPPPVQEGAFGAWGEFHSLVDFGKAMCRYGVNALPADSPIRFRESQEARDGASLWVYGTPGERFYLDWEIRGDWLANVKKKLFSSSPQTTQGALQIDIAAAGDYTPAELGVIQANMKNATGASFVAPVYSQSTMLAAKLSWLLRGLQRSPDGKPPVWSGAAKDLYDIWVLLDRGDIDSDVFQRALDAFSKSDDIQWSSLQALMMDVPQSSPDDLLLDNWAEFVVEHGEQFIHLDETPPMGGAWLQSIANRLAPHLGAFYSPAEEPWYAEISDAENLALDEYHVYADWLEERGDLRAAFLRALSGACDDPLAAQRTLDAIPHLPPGWMQRLCGASKRCRHLITELENVAADVPGHDNGGS